MRRQTKWPLHLATSRCTKKDVEYACVCVCSVLASHVTAIHNNAYIAVHHSASYCFMLYFLVHAALRPAARPMGLCLWIGVYFVRWMRKAYAWNQNNKI